MVIADAGDIQAFARRLLGLTDQLDALADKTNGLVDAMGESWADDSYHDFAASLKECAGPIASFTEAGRTYAQGLDQKAAAVARTSSHAVNSGGAGTASGGGSGGSARLAETPGATGATSVQPGGGRYQPGSEATQGRQPVLGFGDACAYRTKSGGVAFLRTSDKAVCNADHVQKMGRCFDCMLHGVVEYAHGPTANMVSVPFTDPVTGVETKQYMTASEFATFLRRANNNRPFTEPIRLCACQSGQDRNGFAAQLSKELGVPVVAPVESIWFDSEGRTLGEVRFGPFSFDRRATWRAFFPDGRAYQCSDRKWGNAKAWKPI